MVGNVDLGNVDQGTQGNQRSNRKAARASAELLAAVAAGEGAQEDQGMGERQQAKRRRCGNTVDAPAATSTPAAAAFAICNNPAAAKHKSDATHDGGVDGAGRPAAVAGSSSAAAAATSAAVAAVAAAGGGTAADAHAYKGTASACADMGTAAANTATAAAATSRSKRKAAATANELFASLAADGSVQRGKKRKDGM
jgi:hypothetical protein